MEKVFVIAGGEWQKPLVRRVKELGYETINSNLYPDSPAFQYADHSEITDVKDMDTNLAIGRKYHVDAVLTDESDIAVPTVAYVSETLELPGIGREKASLFTNKYKMCRFAQLHGLNVPEHACCMSGQEAAVFVKGLLEKGICTRAIMKPLDSQSSRGVYILKCPEDALLFYELSASCSTDKKSVIVERYIEGTEFTVDGIVVGGQHYSLAVSEKKHFSYNPNVASELFFSYENPNFDYEVLRRQNDRFVELAELPFGLTHAEYKYENGKFYLIEIAARGGGTRISSDIVPRLSGVDVYKILIEKALGHKSAEESFHPVIPYERCGVLKFLDAAFDGGRVAAIEGVEEILADPDVLELHLEFRVGDELHLASDDRSRIGFYIAFGDSRQKLRNKMKWIESTLRIRYV